MQSEAFGGLSLAPNPGRGLGYFKIGPFTPYAAAAVAIELDDVDLRRCGPLIPRALARYRFAP